MNFTGKKKKKTPQRLTARFLHYHQAKSILKYEKKKKKKKKTS